MDQQTLQELLHYDATTGIFTWRTRAGRQAAGSVAGSCKGTGGYVRVMLGGTLYLAHRLAFLYVTGAWPANTVDHINGNPVDNRWSNLRDVTPRVNNQNRHASRTRNKTGFLGVTQDTRDGRFYASIFVAGRKRGLGGFTTPQEAYAAYVKAKRLHHTGCTL